MKMKDIMERVFDGDINEMIGGYHSLEMDSDETVKRWKKRVDSILSSVADNILSVVDHDLPIRNKEQVSSKKVSVVKNKKESDDDGMIYDVKVGKKTVGSIVLAYPDDGNNDWRFVSETGGKSYGKNMDRYSAILGEIKKALGVKR